MHTRFMQTGFMHMSRLGLMAWMCGACGGGAENADEDGWYEIPVPPSPPARREGLSPFAPSAGPPEAPATGGLAGDAALEHASPPDGAEPGGAGLVLRGLTAAGELSESELYELLAAAPAVCFGETHDNPAHHLAQARAADELAARARSAGVPFALGFEMFQRPFQTALTGFTLGRLDEAALLRDSEYAMRWGYDIALYRPLLDLVREYQLPALALNAPSELTRKIASDGLDGLSAEERASLPELDLNDAEHRAYVSALLGTFHSDQASLENPYTVQVVWDETMAETASEWLSSSGEGARLLIIAGLGHCHRSAIPARITRRTGLPALAVAPTIGSGLGVPGSPTLNQYDVLVVLGD
jgi:uncharacterized iron-regulated protein